MVVAHGANSVDVRAVGGANAYVLRGEDLEVPFGRFEGGLEYLVGQEGEAGALVSRGHDYHVARNLFFPPRAILRDAGSAVIEADAALCEAEDVAAEPLGFFVTDLLEDVGVYHGRSREKAVGCGCQIG